MAISLKPLPALPANSGRLTLGAWDSGSPGETYGHIACLSSTITQWLAAHRTSRQPKGE